MRHISIAHLIDQTWETYRDKFRDLVSISAWMLVPSLFSMVALVIYPGAVSLLTNRPIGTLDIAAMIIWILANQIALPVVGLWTFIATVKYLNKEKEDKKISMKGLSRESWKNFWPMVWVNLLVGLVLLAIILIMAPGLAINLAGAALNSALLARFGGVILILSAVVALFLVTKYAILYAFAPVALATEGVRGVKSLLRSQKLTQGRILHVLMLRIFSALVFGVIIFAIVSIGNFLVSMFVSYVAGLNSELLAKLDSIQSVISTAIILVLFNPVFYVLEFVLFDNLRKTE
jgi:hypothetical protein